MAMEDMGKSFNNRPSDWTGDPCLPKENSWTGVSCSQTNDLARVTSVLVLHSILVGVLKILIYICLFVVGSFIYLPFPVNVGI